MKRGAASSPSDSPDEQVEQVERLRGVVQRLYPERGFGFIRASEGDDLGHDFFFHSSGLEECQMDDLEEGLTVQFVPRLTAKGKRAERIQRAG